MPKEKVAPLVQKGRMSRQRKKSRKEASEEEAAAWGWVLGAIWKEVPTGPALPPPGLLEQQGMNFSSGLVYVEASWMRLCLVLLG